MTWPDDQKYEGAQNSPHSSHSYQHNKQTNKQWTGKHHQNKQIDDIKDTILLLAMCLDDQHLHTIIRKSVQTLLAV